MFTSQINTRHTRKQGNVAQSKDQNKALETGHKVTQSSQLPDKEF